jgi:transcriptional regulator with AAA-type ATPase domain
MSTVFKSTAQRNQAEIIVQIVRCNPFLPERQALEKKLLGSQFSTTSVVHNLDDFEGSNRNQALIKVRAKQILEDLELRLQPNPTPDSEEQWRDFVLLGDLIKFHVYHEFQVELNDHIAESHRTGVVLRPITFYGGFESSLRRWTQYLPSEFPIVQQPAHYLALFHQIRRAFFHIYNFLIGKSNAIARLRGEVWQSIFSENLLRYENHLTGRMREISSLILGPSGSGKEVVAKAISLSAYIPFNPATRKFERNVRELFLPLNVAAMAPTLVESELFGHTKGAFTGAERDRQGFFETCGEYGTVFLDEIGELDTSLQVKLLRILQDRQFYRVGDVKPSPFRGRVIAATNRVLEYEIAAGKFREDLYFRLCSDVIRTPSLREQLDDDPETLNLLLKYCCGSLLPEKEALVLEREVLQWISKNLPTNYAWPGNVRELEQITKGVLMKGQRLDRRILLGNHRVEGEPFSALTNRTATLNEALALYVRHVHAQSDSVQETARLLKVDHRTVKKHLGDE